MSASLAFPQVRGVTPELGFPAQNPPERQPFAGYPQPVCDYTGEEPPQEAGGGFSDNRDTRYVYAHAGRVHGQVLVLRGLLPSAPRTRNGERTLAAGQQVRYWSITDGAGDFDYATLLIRNVVPDQGLDQAVGRVTRIDEESDVMGDFLPHGRYMSTAEFEKPGERPQLDW
ncbi:hypothetical protein ACIQZN_26615 [Streptomyces sp. NPDC097595]|uniref:hypothetical protein n=1 Tax=Streptomyces sp. NPDC097595 TaxID=3366090 RepID=UPI00380126CE